MEWPGPLLVPQIHFFGAGVFGLVVGQLLVGDGGVAIELGDVERIAVAAFVEPAHADERVRHLVDLQQGFEERFRFIDWGQLDLLYCTGANLAIAVELIEEILDVEGSTAEELVGAECLCRRIVLRDGGFVGALIIGPYVLTIAIDVLAAGDTDMIAVAFELDGAAFAALEGS